MANKIPSSERGTVPGLRATYDLRHGNGYSVDPLEYVPELTWPNSVAVYDKIRKSDGQFGGLLRAMMLPICNAQWDLDTEGCRPEVVALVRSELGISEPGKSTRRRRREGIVWRDHVRDALLMLPFGHMAFEQVYSVGKPAPGQEDTKLDRVVHLRKLAPRYPRTITDIRVDRDGGLVGIFQNQPPSVAMQARSFDPIFIPVEQLVFYVVEREGADWTGTSVFRSAYKHWFLKEVLLRLSGQVLERNGMGLPVVSYDDESGGVSKDDALWIARSARAGSEAGVAVPKGTEFKLAGVEGTVPDILPYINYHDQAAAKSLLAMFMDLGHDTGARSLGETFVDLFTDNLQFFANEIAVVATEHIVRDLVEWNFGPDEPYPLVTPGNMAANKEVSSTVMSTLVTAGVITPDGDLEDEFRKRLGLPQANPESVRKSAMDEAAEKKAAAEAELAANPPKLVAVGSKTAASEGATELERFVALARRMEALASGEY